MKKFLALILMLCCALSLLTACGGDSPDVGGSDEAETSADSGNEVTTAPDEAESETDAPEEVDIELTLPDEFEIRYTIATDDGTSEYYYAKNDEGYYISLGDDKSEAMYYVKQDNDKYMLYSFSEDEGKYVKAFDDSLLAYIDEETIMFDKDTVEAQAMLITSYFSYYSLYEDNISKSGTEKICGIKCDKYSYSYSLADYSYEYEFFVDPDTGMCLKSYAAGSDPDESGFVSFECSEYKTSGVSLPEHE